MKLILENFRKFINEEAASIAGQDMPLEALYGDVLDKITLVLNTAYGEDNYNLYKILTDLAEFHSRNRISENDDKVSKKISYLMDKEGKPQKQAVAMALDMEERGKLQEGFPGAELVSQFIGFIQQNPEVAVAAISANAAALGIAEMLETIADKVRQGLANRDSNQLEEGFRSGEKVTHDEYGAGVVTHPGTKNTDVAVKFDKDTGRGKSIKVSRGSLKKAVKEEMDAMRGADRPGAGIEDIAQPEDEETRDRAFDSPEGRLITLINAREALGKMTRDELKDLSMSLDADMVATLRHILANPMYAPMEEGQDEAQDLIRKAEFEKSKGRLHQGDVDRIKDRLAAGERVHAIKRDYPRNFPR
tara:strand:- start:46 stop:1128 length:1083 start_codon:yes stop_codon:yes gene_type:complete